ncbi:hypothetical protein NECAME_04975 [Necator americanus]|uniref:Uncharacterized protein n=1 Tax=Necator americanus TaxID=51031 RepID=W2SKV7_NECAM|nr:hypothetical protein NECAME_04975 [Necator americanus]ETN70284.1 hypothetical protein NECAME_04975 [Necator americanus]
MKVLAWYITIFLICGCSARKVAQNRSRSGKNKIIPRSITKTEHSNGSITYNLLAITDMDEAGSEGPEKGFSAFDFIPNSGYELIVAIKSKEVTGSSPESYITVFNVNGTVLLPDQILDRNLKEEKTLDAVDVKASGEALEK